MITVVCSSQYPLDDFKKHIVKTSGLEGKIEFLGYENKGEFSLTEIYNRGLNESKNDIVVFCHHDITIETKQWGEKLLKLFNKNPNYGILGVAGTKSLPSSGKWWENRKKMYGRVAHTHEGKTWLSSYSEDLNKEIEEVVVVDGVFFAVDKTKMVKPFNETVKGFHYYDITFCFENYLSNVKIGVSTIIRVNHKSIGITNDEWGKNRVEFAEKFKEELPVNIKKVLRKGQKLKVLISCLNFSNLTGSELYVFELAKQLIKEGCDVTICSTIGAPLGQIANKLGVKLFSLQEPPGFKLGDGKWVLKGDGIEELSTPNTLYKLSDIDFDVIHCNHTPVTEHMLRLYPETPMICSIHSEVISLENPVINPQIKKYIAIRPEIRDYLINNFSIEPDMIEVIYNPIDVDKFFPTKSFIDSKVKRTLFVGTIDYLRKETIKDLIKTTKENNEELWLVGKYNGVTAEELEMGEHVKYFPPTINVEKYIRQCHETAGILLGRTTVEGWMCNKKGLIYDVDSSGNIISKKLYDVPLDIDKFNGKNVVKQIIAEYLKILD